MATPERIKEGEFGGKRKKCRKLKLNLKHEIGKRLFSIIMRKYCRL